MKYNAKHVNQMYINSNHISVSQNSGSQRGDIITCQKIKQYYLYECSGYEIQFGVACKGPNVSSHPDISSGALLQVS